MLHFALAPSPQCMVCKCGKSLKTEVKLNKKKFKFFNKIYLPVFGGVGDLINAIRNEKWTIDPKNMYDQFKSPQQVNGTKKVVCTSKELHAR